jgi:hypothetical protein
MRAEFVGISEQRHYAGGIALLMTAGTFDDWLAEVDVDGPVRPSLYEVLERCTLA